MIEKPCLVVTAGVVGVVLLGMIGYKIFKKKNGKLMTKAKKTVSSIRTKTNEMIANAKASFAEGYASA